MIIEKVEAIPFSVPLRQPTKFAKGTLSSLDHVLIRIRTSDGLIGIAEAPVRQMIYGDSLRSIIAAVHDWFAPAILGLRVTDSEQAWDRMRRYPGNHCARSAIDLAMYDIVGQAAGMPLHEMLGGYARAVDVCHILAIGSPESIADQAVGAIARHGFRWFKIKAGLDAVEDTKVITAVRRAVGPGVGLTVDCNEGYAAHVAERLLPCWRELDIAWVEEPCPGNEFNGRGRVAKAAGIPIMIDESAFLPNDTLTAGLRGDASIVAIKLARTGIFLSRKVVNIAETLGMRTVIGSQADSEIGTAASVQFAAAHRTTSMDCAELSFFLGAEGRITEETLEIVDGRLSVSDMPGLGMRIDNDRLSHFRLDR